MWMAYNEQYITSLLCHVKKHCPNVNELESALKHEFEAHEAKEKAMVETDTEHRVLMEIYRGLRQDMKMSNEEVDMARQGVDGTNLLTAAHTGQRVLANSTGAKAHLFAGIPQQVSWKDNRVA